MNQLSGYIELEYNGQIIPFKFGSNSWALFCELHGIELHEIAESGVLGKFEDGKMIKPPDITKMRDLFHSAHVAISRSRNEKPKINLFEMGDWMDDDSNVVLKLQDTMLKSKIFGFSLDDLGKEDEKGNFQNPGE